MEERLANPKAGHGDGVERLPRWNEVAETPEGRDMGGINLKSAANRGVRASRVGGAMHGKQFVRRIAGHLTDLGTRTVPRLRNRVRRIAEQTNDRAPTHTSAEKRLLAMAAAPPAPPP